MAIYWYYPSKDALLDAVVDKLMVASRRRCGRRRDKWIDALRNLAHAYRRIAHDHPRRSRSSRRADSRAKTRTRSSSACSRSRATQASTTRRRRASIGSSARTAAASRSTSWLRRVVPRIRARPDFVASSRGTRPSPKWLEPEYLDEMFEFGLELQLTALARSEPDDTGLRRGRALAAFAARAEPRFPKSHRPRCDSVIATGPRAADMSRRSPISTCRPRPTGASVVLVHGGGFVLGSRQMKPMRYLAAQARRGRLSVFAFDYR